MLKYKIGDVITVVELNTTIDEREGIFIGGVGEIIVADKIKAYPYEVKFYQKGIQELNMKLGSRLFDENELRLA
jgi:hypothetical protein